MLKFSKWFVSGTIGLSLSSCSLPGSGPIFSLGHDEMEIGLGVHGEPGVGRLKLKTAKETVTAMLNHLTNRDSSTRLPLNASKMYSINQQITAYNKNFSCR